MNKIIITLTIIILSFSIYGCGETETTKTTGGNTPNTPNIPTPPYFPPEEKLIFDKYDIYNIPIALKNIEAENIDDVSIVIHIRNYTVNDYKNIKFTPTITHLLLKIINLFLLLIILILQQTAL